MMPKLIIIRGNSGAGKSTLAHQLRMKMGYGTALIEQDYIRRILLREPDKKGQPNITLIKDIAQFALTHNFDVIIEGILPTSRYGDMLHQLIKGHSGPTFVYYIDIGWEESLKRHQTRGKSEEFGGDMMKDWFVPHDVLGIKGEIIIPESSTPRQSFKKIYSTLA